jgi:WD40 repeat protein
VSDDRPSRAEQHLINEARKHQARQPQPPGKVTVTRVGRFNGMNMNVHWRAQAWSPDGQQLAYGGADKHGKGVLHLWHADSGHIESFTVRHLTHDLAGPVISLAWAPDGKHLASLEQDQASGQPVVRIRSQAEGPRPVQLPPGLPAQQVTWSPDGGTLAVSGPDCPGTVLIDAASGSQRRLLDNLSGPVAWQPGGRLIAGTFETNVLLCDPATGGRVGRLAGQEHHATALAWDGHGRHLAVADGERIIVWEAEAGTIQWRIPWTTLEGDRGPDGTVTSIQWLDGGGYHRLGHRERQLGLRREVLRTRTRPPQAGRRRRGQPGRPAPRRRGRLHPRGHLADQRRPAALGQVTNRITRNRGGRR